MEYIAYNSNEKDYIKEKTISLNFFVAILFNSLLLVDLVRMLLGSDSLSVKVVQYIIYLLVFFFSSNHTTFYIQLSPLLFQMPLLIP